MCTLKKLSILGGLALLALAVFVPASRADVSNQATEMTFNQPVRIPRQVLPAGTYWFTVLDSDFGTNNVVRIYNADRSKIISTVNARTTDHTGGYGEVVTTENGIHWPTGKLVLTFAEGRNQQPSTLLDWYYPGRPDGHAFIYSSQRQNQLDEESHETIAINANARMIGSSPADFE